jgi:hypothetical protein
MIWTFLGDQFRRSSDDGATLRLRGPNALYCDFFQHKFAPIVHELLAEFGRAGTNLVVRPD